MGLAPESPSKAAQCPERQVAVGDGGRSARAVALHVAPTIAYVRESRERTYSGRFKILALIRDARGDSPQTVHENTHRTRAVTVASELGSFIHAD